MGTRIAVGGKQYGGSVAGRRSYSDEQLLRAIRESHSWRGVLRALALTGTSSKAIDLLRRRADYLGADYQHFVRARGRTDSRIAETPASPSEGSVDSALYGQPSLGRLRRAGPLLAAAWYTLSGHEVSWPLEPSRYDLLVTDDHHIRRVQVKTTTVRERGAWKVYLSTSSGGRRIYAPDEVDEFFIINGELDCYRVPLSAVSGLQAIHLRAYSRYRLHAFQPDGPADVRPRRAAAGQPDDLV